jgi:hypothetical protein
VISPVSSPSRLSPSPSSFDPGSTPPRLARNYLERAKIPSPLSSRLVSPRHPLVQAWLVPYQISPRLLIFLLCPHTLTFSLTSLASRTSLLAHSFHLSTYSGPCLSCILTDDRLSVSLQDKTGYFPSVAHWTTYMYHTGAKSIEHRHRI